MAEGTKDTAVTPGEREWLRFYRDNPSIWPFFEEKWTGQIRVNVHQGRAVSGDARPHLKLNGGEKG